MIIVSVKLVSRRRVEELARMVITNRGDSSDLRVSDYDVFVAHKSRMHKVMEFPARRGRVLGYKRLQYNVWRLVLRALRSAFPEER